jgi:outer membrane receptor for ferrienterochelin and colicins
VPQIQSAMINLTVSNLFSCTSENVVYSTPTGGQPFSRIASRDRGCGLDRKHMEMVNMPQIGTMMFLGIRYNR